MTPAVGTVVAERFRLVRPLGQGGMGSVWLAEHLGLEVPCALKFIQVESIQAGSKDFAELRRRFEREAKIAAQIRSSNVVHILDHGVWQEMPYIAMEYLEGEDLESRLGRVGRLSPVETATITAQVARALGKAHAAGLVHRDLKPANIFLARDDDAEVVKVLDFGIAKDITPSVSSTTKTGSVLGTPAYMSPEQAQGIKSVDHRSDLWSLAVVVFECVTGRLPFESEAFGDLLLKIMVHPLPVPSTLAQVPPGFDGWWARAAAREPERRFQSAKELADALVLALGISTGGGGVDLRTSISGTFSIPPRVSLSSAPSLDFGDGRTPGPGSVSGPASAVSSGPLVAEAATLMAPSSGNVTPPSLTPPAAGLFALPEPGDSTPAVRPQQLTAGPVSMQTRSSSSGGVRRLVVAMAAGVLVAGIGAFLLLRGGSAPPASADPTTASPAPEHAAPPPGPTPQVQAVGDAPTAEPVAPTPGQSPTATPTGAEPRVRPQSGAGSAGTTPRAGSTGTSSAGPRQGTPPSPGTTTSPNKTRDPRDLGI